MDRRGTVKLLLLAAATPSRLLRASGAGDEASFVSEWNRWPDMQWVGPQYWGNRLQDWVVRDGVVECGFRGPDRTLHCLTHRIEETPFETTVLLDPSRVLGQAEAFVGVRMGVRGRFADYRSAAVHGAGIDVGLDGTGALFIGDRDRRSPRRGGRVDLTAPVELRVSGAPAEGGVRVAARIASADASELASLERVFPAPETLAGNVALVSHFPDAPGRGTAATFGSWSLSGSGVSAHPASAYGPIMFAQYTVHRGTLKLTAQLAPVDGGEDVRVVLELRVPGTPWREVGESSIDPLARTARFRIESWDASRAAEYRVRLVIPGLSDGFDYTGIIAAEPSADRAVKAAVFSCNADHGFPDTEVVEHVSAHAPDLCLFLGDQFYESSGGFGIQTDSVEEAALDMLHKWYMFGWSYRELFRDVPAAFIPDDHDVYHGNVWGEGGKRAPTDEGWGAAAQDRGGYKMRPEWVNAVQTAQTSHLPDPVDPAPVEQGIGVYFTRWDYGGVSFAIIEDRKFKSAPANVLPPEAQVLNGWIQNPAFDIREHGDPDGAELLGDRQMRFLEEWAEDWGGGAYMKVLLSQTNFAAVHTIPETAMSGAVLPGLPVPQPGRYVQGDKLAVDMDSNGWPSSKRNDVLRILRTCRAFHIAGDQHLATVVRHGIDAFGDAGFSFTGPALNNIWPRRWWPPQALRQRALDGAPDYAGDFYDGFGNRITVHAVANPRATGLEPAIIRDRSTGYGIVRFDTKAGRIRIECWPRYANPELGDGGQYSDWPVAIGREDGDGRRPVGARQQVEVAGLSDPVVELRGDGGELVYAYREVGQTFSLPAYRRDDHRLRVGDPELGEWRERRLTADEWGREVLSFRFGP